MDKSPKELIMKNTLKLIGILTFAVIIGLSFWSCDSELLFGDGPATGASATDLTGSDLIASWKYVCTSCGSTHASTLAITANDVTLTKAGTDCNSNTFGEGKLSLGTTWDEKPVTDGVSVLDNTTTISKALTTGKGLSLPMVITLNAAKDKITVGGRTFTKVP